LPTIVAGLFNDTPDRPLRRTNPVTVGAGDTPEGIVITSSDADASRIVVLLVGMEPGDLPLSVIGLLSVTAPV
jgi:hypothetical protein